MVDSYYEDRNFARFVNTFSLTVFLMVVLTFVAAALPIITSVEPSAQPAIVSDGFEHSMSFDEMFSRSKYWR